LGLGSGFSFLYFYFGLVRILLDKGQSLVIALSHLKPMLAIRWSLASHSWL
jgi:hypothetical protein